jgi:hypothetical protein
VKDHLFLTLPFHFLDSTLSISHALLYLWCAYGQSRYRSILRHLTLLR